MVEIKNLSFGYRKEKLFSGLDLKLEPGDIHGLLGKNGVGKTTLSGILRAANAWCITMIPGEGCRACWRTCTSFLKSFSCPL